jgi:uncharacterized protein (DUF1330 family)
LKSNAPKKKLKERISRKDAMKKGNWVVAYNSISDESATKAYAELAEPALQPFGGRFLTRTSSKVHPHEGGLQQRTVIVEFDSYETALAAYGSEAYKGSSGTRLGRRTRLPHCRRGVVHRFPDPESTILCVRKKALQRIG